MSTKIWVVENRRNTETHTECTVAFIASTVEKAIEWMKENKDYDYHDFWWTVFSDEVDVDSTEQIKPEKDIYIFNKDVEEIFWQPNLGEDIIYYGDRVRATMNFVIDGPLNDCVFEATLEKIVDGEVFFTECVLAFDEETNPAPQKIADFSTQAENIHYITKLFATNKNSKKIDTDEINQEKLEALSSFTGKSIRFFRPSKFENAPGREAIHFDTLGDSTYSSFSVFRTDEERLVDLEGFLDQQWDSTFIEDDLTTDVKTNKKNPDNLNSFRIFKGKHNGFWIYATL